MDILTKSVDQGVPVDVIYMDLQKSFAIVLHKRLLSVYILNIMELQATFLRWINGFLSNRSQCVVFNGEKSCWQDVMIKSGVLQGSILGPLLFLIYVNDIPESILSHIFYLQMIQSYFYTGRPYTQLQTDLDNLVKWCKMWQLNSNVLWSTIYFLNSVLLESVNFHKDFGIIFDANLKFHQHTSEVAMKANRVLACMKRSFIDLNACVLLRLYKSLVQPILEYGNVGPIMY